MAAIIERTPTEINLGIIGADPRPEDFADPIQFIYNEHERLRLCCNELVALAHDPFMLDAMDTAQTIQDYLTLRLPLHIADEEKSLFRLLRRCSTLDDDVVPTLVILVAEHRADIESGRPLLTPVRAIAAGRKPPDPVQFLHYAHAFRILQRRHQAMENNDVLPLALERLGPDEIAELRANMLARRGLGAALPSRRS